MTKEIFVAFGIDVDAVGGWLGSYGGEDSPGDISRGVFAGEVGVPRLTGAGPLRPARHVVLAGALDRDVPPGVRRGRRGRARDRRARVLAREPDRDDAAAGVGHPRPLHRPDHRTRRARPTGYVAPWWEFSSVTNELLLERGITYDHSLMHRDFEPYYVRVGDSWTPIDYDGRGRELDEAAGPRRGDGPRRDPGQLVPRRPAADDVHQEQPEQPRLRQPAPHRGDVAATSSTGSTASPTTPSSRSRSTRTSRAGRRCC